MDSWNKGRIAGVVAFFALVALAAPATKQFLTNPSNAEVAKLSQTELETVMDRILAEQFEKDNPKAIAERISIETAINKRLAAEKLAIETRDKAEAIARGISIETVLKERQAMLEEAEAAENMRIRANQLAGPGIIVFAVATATMLYRFRRKIVANFSPRWRRRSKAFRTWVFTSVCWAIAVFFYVFLADPYAELFNNDEMTSDQIMLHMFSVMIIPSLFFGVAWFGYKRFVE